MCRIEIYSSNLVGKSLQVARLCLMSCRKKRLDYFYLPLENRLKEFRQFFSLKNVCYVLHPNLTFTLNNAAAAGNPFRR